MVGTALTKKLQESGHSVSHLSRSIPGGSKIKTFLWRPSESFIDEAAFAETEILINLAGANVAGKLWTKSYKKVLWNSRIDSTRTLVEAIPHMPKLKKFISGSAIGYYPNTEDVLDEKGRMGSGFLSRLCHAWEEEAIKASCPTAIVRTGIVLSTEGGFLNAMGKPVKFGLGAPMGKGNQQISWIHIDDLCELFACLIVSDKQGIFNGVSGDYCSNDELTSLIAKKLKRPYFLPGIPAFVLKALLGDFSSELLADHSLYSARAEEINWNIRYTDIEDALADLL